MTPDYAAKAREIVNSFPTAYGNTRLEARIARALREAHAAGLDEGAEILAAAFSGKDSAEDLLCNATHDITMRAALQRGAK